MKKNILTIIVMAVSIVNLVLGIVLVFSIVPASNKTAALVDKVASVIDLNIDDPNSEEQDYTIDDLVAYTKTYDSAVNINLKKDAGDDSNHYAHLAAFTLSVFSPFSSLLLFSSPVSKIHSPPFIPDSPGFLFIEGIQTALHHFYVITQWAFCPFFKSLKVEWPMCTLFRISSFFKSARFCNSPM